MADLSVVHAERVVECPFSIAADHAAEFLRALETGSHLSFGIHTDVGDGDERRHDEIRFAWHAQTRWLPNFAGTLRFSIVSHDETRLHLDGTYEPPFGFAGTLFDAAFGRHIAAATAGDVLSRVSTAMESAERAFREAHPAIP